MPVVSHRTRTRLCTSLPGSGLPRACNTVASRCPVKASEQFRREHTACRDFRAGRESTCDSNRILKSTEGVQLEDLLFSAFTGRLYALNWVAVKELNLNYYIGETLLFTIYTNYGNLI